MKPLARAGRSLAALPLALLLVLFPARSPAAAVSPLPAESGAALTAADGERGQAVRHTGEAVSTAAPAEVPPPKRGVATQAAKPSQTTSQRDRSRVRAAVESRAGVARALAFAASGAAATHTSALPPPNA